MINAKVHNPKSVDRESCGNLPSRSDGASWALPITHGRCIMAWSNPGGNLLSASRQLAPSRFSLVWVCRHCSQFKTDELGKWGTIYVLIGWHRCVFNKQLCCLTLLKLDHLLVYWVKVRSFVFICILNVCLHEADVRNRLGSLFSPTAACDGLSSLSPSVRKSCDTSTE